VALIPPLDALTVGAVQFRPSWLRKTETTDRMLGWIGKAAADGIDLLAFPETALSGYPFWICRTNGAAFEDARQRRAYGQFLDAAVEIDGPEITRLVEASRDAGISVCLGINERGSRVARGSVFCTAVMIDAVKGLIGAHRKLMPTHDERLVWAQGDARDLRPHRIGPALVGTLNCWENWMPLARYALYRGGEDIHLSLWPGNPSVCRDIAKLTAMEGRVWSVAVSGVLAMSDVPTEFEFHADMMAQGVDVIFSGGSMIIDPTGQVVLAAEDNQETLISASLSLASVREARHSFDPAGHYARADVFGLTVARHRVEDDC
jgi:nitrilase